MTSQCSSYCKSASRVPYVGRISAGKNDDVNFIYQFVKHIKHGNNLKWEDHYLIGTPTKFPNYGDFSRTFCMRTYGFDISTSPWQNEADFNYVPQIDEIKMIDNYIDILFHEAVYPIRVSIYEIYNPGNIIRIWAQKSDTQRYLLWEGSPQIVPPKSRLFSPLLQSCSFKTKRLRLEFKHSTWDYCTKLDGVMLIGTSELIVPKNPEENLTDMLKRINCSMYFQHETEDIHNLTTDYENAHLDIVHLQENFSEYCIIHESDIEEMFSKCNLDCENISREVVPDYVQHFRQRYLHFRSKYNSNSAKRENLSSDGSMELSYFNFSKLPDEIILKVLKKLDFRALCRISQVNKRFNNLTRDCLLYTCLNVRNIRLRNPTYMYNMFYFFTLRCKYLQQLDLTASKFSCEDFETFLNNCGNQITHLRLNKCLSVDNTALLKISKICKNLRILDLRRCRLIEDKGYSYLENLESLEHLSIGYIHPDRIKTQTLCRILQKNQQMRELHLEMVNVNLKTVVIKLRNSCPNLEVISLINCPYLLQDINNIIIDMAACKNLRKVILHTFGNVRHVKQSLERLLSNCQHLEEVHLSRFFTENLNLLTECKNLKKLYLYNINFVIFNSYSIFNNFEQCPKLQELYFINCKTNKYILDLCREKCPHLSVFVKTKNYLRYQGEGEYIDIDI